MFYFWVVKEWCFCLRKSDVTHFVRNDVASDGREWCDACPLCRRHNIIAVGYIIRRSRHHLPVRASIVRQTCFIAGRRVGAYRKAVLYQSRKGTRFSRPFFTRSCLQGIVCYTIFCFRKEYKWCFCLRKSDVTHFVRNDVAPVGRNDVMLAHCAEGTTSLP